MKENVLERNARLDTERKIADFRVKQQMDYAFKVKYAKIRAWEFYDHPDVAGSCYVAVGGLDSITLLLFLRSIGIDVPAISVSSLEDKSIQLIHKQLGVKPLKPLKSKVEVLREYGWPVISKEVAGKISLLQNPSEKNATVRHAIITGETGAYGGFRTGTRMKLAQKWLEIFGGYENENEGVSYKTPDFLVSDKCCYYLKEKPCSDYAKETGSFPYMGLMASEGGRRQKALMMNGCNYISPGTKRSCPFAIFSRQDLLQLALDLQVPVPEIYGEIVRDTDGTLRTTKAQRTGCSMCGFGVQMRIADLESLCNYTRLRELAEADKDGRVVVLPCKGYSSIDIARDGVSYRPDHWNIYLTAYAHGQNTPSGLKVGLFDIGEVERAMQEMEGKKDG